jgi:hypothetical protein
VLELIETLNEEGYWPTLLVTSSQPYIGPGPAEPTPGEFAQTHVGDQYDTSPFSINNPFPPDHIDFTPEYGISTNVFIRNLSTLLQFFAQGE